jgi:uracil phosphoribosyltransferase
LRTDGNIKRINSETFPGTLQSITKSTESNPNKMTDVKELHPKLVISPSKAHFRLFCKLRDVNTSSEEYVMVAKRAMRILAEDSLAEFPAKPLDITTPCGIFQGCEELAPTDICAVSIIRSGDALLEAVRDLVPGIKVGKILIQRDETHPDKIPKLFYSKMPPGCENQYILLCDPMLATGGSAKMAIDTLVSQFQVDPEKIIFANMICAPEGLRAMAEAYPQVKIVTACVDECLNADKFIVPGLGDYGDRFFNTA